MLYYPKSIEIVKNMTYEFYILILNSNSSHTEFISVSKIIILSFSGLSLEHRFWFKAHKVKAV
ncbi:MAG: hypothetical protein PHE73_07770 [Sulfurovaceae bacterium]|nr:hypothetical protein [Sulfurovaceae bacterium]